MRSEIKGRGGQREVALHECAVEGRELINAPWGRLARVRFRVANSRHLRKGALPDVPCLGGCEIARVFLTCAALGTDETLKRVD